MFKPCVYLLFNFFLKLSNCERAGKVESWWMRSCFKKKKKRINADSWSNTEKFTASYLENKHFPAKNSQSVEVPITDVRFGPRIGRLVTSGWPGRLRLSVIFPWVYWRDRTVRWHCWQRSCWWWDPVRWTFKNGSKM